jgi:transcriptional regulator
MPRTDRLYGTLDALILKSLSRDSRHGYGILHWVAERTGNQIRVEEGSLYPALYRMERDGWIESQWDVTDEGRRAKFYTITTKGRRHLKSETNELASFWSVVMPVLLPSA